MEYSDIREAQEKEEINHETKTFDWEKKNMPLLHSGFCSPSKKDPARGILALSVYFDEGSYVLRLQDRDAQERAFVEVDSLGELFQTMELKLKAGKLKWRQIRNDWR